MRPKILVVTLLILFISAAVVISGCSQAGGANKGIQEKSTYYCPMHPTYTSDRPGDCPICNMKLVKKENAEFIIGDDFGAPDETIISSKFDRPVFVHHYPAAVKAFYMKENPKDLGYAMGCDLLATEGYGEIIGGGQREDNFEILQKKIHEHHLKDEDFRWYLDLRRYGSFPHSGFGLGLERTVAWICGLPHVRETIPFPRLYGRSYP